MTEEQIYKQVLNKIDWILEIAKRKNWTIKVKPFIDRPATIEEIDSVEKQIGKTIPDDLRKLFLFSRHLEFSYQFDETLSEEFSKNFSGDIYWNLNSLAEQYANFQEWVKASIDPEYNDRKAIEITEKLWHDKLPLMDVPNGDIIAIGNNPSEIIYFSHEGDTMHGKMLGDSLWNFLDFYSRIGFAGSEDWQLEPFFDFDKNIMVTHGDKVDRYGQLIEQKGLGVNSDSSRHKLELETININDKQNNMAIDLEQIKQNYSEFEDYKIEYLAKNEAGGLDPDVIPILINEIHKRGLSPDLINGIEAQTEELTESELKKIKYKISSLTCPECGEKNGPLVGSIIRTVKSFIIMTSYKNAPVITCKSCADKKKKNAMISTALLGWWGFPTGLYRTPIALIAAQTDKNKSEEISAKIITEFVLENIGEIKTNWNKENELVEFIRYFNNQN